MKVKNEDAIDDFILREAKSKESLRKRISDSVWEYHTGRYLSGLITSLLLFSMLIYFCIFTAKIPTWGLYPIAIAIFALLESKRNARRVDAMIKLSEFDSNATNASLKVSPNQQET